MEVHFGGMEGRVGGFPGNGNAHPGAVETHLGGMEASHYCSLSLWRVARGSKLMFLELIHGLFIT